MKNYIKYLLFALLLVMVPVLAQDMIDTTQAIHEAIDSASGVVPDKTSIVMDSLKEVKQEVKAVNDSIKAASEDPIFYSSKETGTLTIPDPVNGVSIVAVVLVALVALRQTILSLFKNFKFVTTTLTGIFNGLGALYAQILLNNGWQNLTWENFVIAALIGLLNMVQPDLDWKGLFAWILPLFKKKQNTSV